MMEEGPAGEGLPVGRSPFPQEVAARGAAAADLFPLPLGALPRGRPRLSRGCLQRLGRQRAVQRAVNAGVSALSSPGGLHHGARRPCDELEATAIELLRRTVVGRGPPSADLTEDVAAWYGG